MVAAVDTVDTGVLCLVAELMVVVTGEVDVAVTAGFCGVVTSV